MSIPNMPPRWGCIKQPYIFFYKYDVPLGLNVFIIFSCKLDFSPVYMKFREHLALSILVFYIRLGFENLAGEHNIVNLPKYKTIFPN